MTINDRRDNSHGQVRSWIQVTGSTNLELLGAPMMMLLAVGLNERFQRDGGFSPCVSRESTPSFGFLWYFLWGNLSLVVVVSLVLEVKVFPLAINFIACPTKSRDSHFLFCHFGGISRWLPGVWFPRRFLRPGGTILFSPQCFCCVFWESVAIL